MTDSPHPPFIRYSDGSISEGRVVAPRANLLDRVGGLEITFIRVDHQTRIQVGPFEIVIESPFRLTNPDGAEHNLDPALRIGLGPVLDLYPDTLATAIVDGDSTLRLRFASGATLVVPGDRSFDAWQVNGADGLLVVCVPGGHGLAVWDRPET